jgi:metal-dependent amidase/aminoacylase/carboxypeptidase family protein
MTLKNALVEAGFLADEMVECSAPGFYVDITGTGPESANPLSIALRADMDALKNEGGEPGPGLLLCK